MDCKSENGTQYGISERHGLYILGWNYSEHVYNFPMHRNCISSKESYKEHLIAENPNSQHMGFITFLYKVDNKKHLPKHKQVQLKLWNSCR